MIVNGTFTYLPRMRDWRTRLLLEKYGKDWYFTPASIPANLAQDCLSYSIFPHNVQAISDDGRTWIYDVEN